MSANIDWNDVIKKEARGSDGYDLGEVQEVASEFVLTQKGVVDKKRFEIPKRLVKDFDGSKLVFDLTELDANPLAEPRKTDEEAVQSRTEIKIPLKRQEVEVNKQSYVTEEIIAKKKPVTETTTVSEEVITEKLKNQPEPQPEQDLME
jgi:hypothetical protein